ALLRLGARDSARDEALCGVVAMALSQSVRACGPSEPLQSGRGIHSWVSRGVVLGAAWHRNADRLSLQSIFASWIDSKRGSGADYGVRCGGLRVARGGDEYRRDRAGSLPVVD